MNASDTIKTSMRTAKQFTTALLADMADQPLMRPQHDQGNHPYWLLGHIVVSEASLLDQYLRGEPHRYSDWQPLFGVGSKPAGLMDGGPSFAELLTALEDVRTATLEYLDALSDDDLDRPCCPVSGPGPRFETVGECLCAMSLHMSFHAGQAADARRAAGRGPLFL